MKRSILDLKKPKLTFSQFIAQILFHLQFSSQPDTDSPAD